ncbi:hypothetical protein D3C75_224210 [compost metagenome]
MKTCFNLVDIPVKDLIADNHPVEDIVAVTQFQTCINCGQTIESLNFVDLNQEIEDDKILSILYMIAVVNGESFKIIIHSNQDDQLLTSFLKYNSESPEKKERVMKYIRQSLE